MLLYVRMKLAGDVLIRGCSCATLNCSMLILLRSASRLVTPSATLKKVEMQACGPLESQEPAISSASMPISGLNCRKLKNNPGWLRLRGSLSMPEQTSLPKTFLHATKFYFKSKIACNDQRA